MQQVHRLAIAALAGATILGALAFSGASVQAGPPCVPGKFCPGGTVTPTPPPPAQECPAPAYWQYLGGKWACEV